MSSFRRVRTAPKPLFVVYVSCLLNFCEFVRSQANEVPSDAYFSSVDKEYQCAAGYNVTRWPYHLINVECSYSRRSTDDVLCYVSEAQVNYCCTSVQVADYSFTHLPNATVGCFRRASYCKDIFLTNEQDVQTCNSRLGNTLDNVNENRCCLKSSLETCYSDLDLDETYCVTTIENPLLEGSSPPTRIIDLTDDVTNSSQLISYGSFLIRDESAPDSSGNDNTDTGLTAGAGVGIGVGATVAVLAIILFCMWCFRKRHRRDKQQFIQYEPPEEYEKKANVEEYDTTGLPQDPEYQATHAPEVTGAQSSPSQNRGEVENAELGGLNRNEMDSSHESRPPAELDTTPREHYQAYRPTGVQ